MNSSQIRKTFLDFFASKNHVIVPSAPMVIKNDPTLMFTNAGMNQFKDLFLGNAPIKFPRIADTQKCLRVSGKHNDLEEVGVDTYHHTMFEMLGNWSFGDYFKKDAIDWAWELLTEVYKIPVDRLYVTVFEGSKEDGLSFDQDAYDYWKKHISEDRIINGNKKDNFWEMGDTGPCGPCTEIHVDIRNESERAKIDGKSLVNESHPQVIEIWNNVFMEFNRKADGSLEKLPAQHVDTGMGFERLCMVLQGKQSNYDTDVFMPLIHFTEQLTKHQYGKTEQEDIAFRVIADHIRTIAFAIADGQLPSNNKAGYVIRRILRRAVRYYYSFLDTREPLLYQLVPVLAEQMGEIFPELKMQKTLIMNVIREEENAFLKTLGNGINRFALYLEEHPSAVVDGSFAFELYDTFGFPLDLTELMAREKGLTVDIDAFNKGMLEQKTRSRAAAVVDRDDWVQLNEAEGTLFVGYEMLEADVEIVKYRKLSAKGKNIYQLVLNTTPFYAESGGQIGDTGVLQNNEESIVVFDTKKENGEILHFTETLPANPAAGFKAMVDRKKRTLTTANHSATHLMHAALRNTLGTHVEQKGSLVNEKYLRFDFSHFAKMSEEEMLQIEQMVNRRIRENIACSIAEMKIDEARKLGAMALFGEKYGDEVRVVTFDPTYSIELCGGTHVKSTGEIGFFKIVSESAVAAGVRRIEAYTSEEAENYIREQLEQSKQMRELLKNPKDAMKALESLIDQQNKLSKKIEALQREKANAFKADLLAQAEMVKGVKMMTGITAIDSPELIKDICFQLKSEAGEVAILIGSNAGEKAGLHLAFSDSLIATKGMDAVATIKELSKEINGGGGGQKFYASAGGTKKEGLEKALEKLKTLM
jgi:alanyl-tRNA synthetase